MVRQRVFLCSVVNSVNTNGYLFLYGIFLIALDLDDPPVNARDCCRRHRQMVVVVSGRGSVVLFVWC